MTIMHCSANGWTEQGKEKADAWKGQDSEPTLDGKETARRTRRGGDRGLLRRIGSDLRLLHDDRGSAGSLLLPPSFWALMPKWSVSS